jgi:hypothetical protein
MIIAWCEGVATVVGLATEPTENLEIFLSELSVLCGKKTLAQPFHHFLVPHLLNLNHE